jgi:hypothetical protein
MDIGVLQKCCNTPTVDVVPNPCSVTTSPKWGAAMHSLSKRKENQKESHTVIKVMRLEAWLRGG